MVSNSYKTTSLKTPIYLFTVGDDFLFKKQLIFPDKSLTDVISGCTTLLLLPEYDADDIKEQ